jgi:hypothetical protein
MKLTGKVGKVCFQVVIAIVLMSQVALAKNTDKYKSYTQITDKEVLVESTDGSKILFTAFDNETIGVTRYAKDETVRLITPENYASHAELKGSIYVEELNGLIQITTTSDNGMVIKIDKKPLEFVVTDKVSHEQFAFDQSKIGTGITLLKDNFMVTDAIEATSNTIKKEL